LSSQESFSTNRASPPSSRDNHSSGPSGKRYGTRAPSTDGGLADVAVSPTGGDRGELPAEAPAWPAEYDTNTGTMLTGERMGLGITTVTTYDEDVPKGTHPVDGP